MQQSCSREALRDRIQAHAHQQAANLRIQANAHQQADKRTGGREWNRQRSKCRCGRCAAQMQAHTSLWVCHCFACMRGLAAHRAHSARADAEAHPDAGQPAGGRLPLAQPAGEPYTLPYLTARAQMQKHIRTLENRLEGACHRHNARRAETRALRGVVDSLRRERLALDEALRKLQRGLAGQRRCLAALLHEARRRPVTGSPAAAAAEPA